MSDIDQRVPEQSRDEHELLRAYLAAAYTTYMNVHLVREIERLHTTNSR